MNGFEKFGVTHLSASQINAFKNAPCKWVAEKLCKKRFPGSPAMTRGIAIEDAVVAALATTATIEDAVEIGHARFDKQYPIGDVKITKERNMIEPSIKLSIEALKDFGKPEFEEQNSQQKISIATRLRDGSAIEIIGYLDLVYPQHGLVIDLKTTNRMPSYMSPEHQLQRAIYSHAKGNHAVKFLYVTPKKISFLEDGDPANILAKAKIQIQRMNDFLLSCDSVEHAAAIVPHNPDVFYWSNAEQIRNELFGT
jgi:hypothetical protein